MGRNQHKKNETIKGQNASPPPRYHNSSPAREQNGMENDFDELTEAGFRRWVITNFSELKGHVLTQCKETKNLKKRLDEMLTRITSLEKNINDLMELKNTAQELHEPRALSLDVEHNVSIQQELLSPYLPTQRPSDEQDQTSSCPHEAFSLMEQTVLYTAIITYTVEVSSPESTDSGKVQ
ncbi:LINE-1 retrotransposable element ORF1 protein [Plecturocebus cupreus]